MHYWHPYFSRFLSFFYEVFFLFQDPIQHLHSLVVSPQAPLGCHGFSNSPCFWWPGQFWEVLARYFVECPSIVCVFFLLSWLEWGCGFWGGRPHRQLSFITLCQRCYRIHTVCQNDITVDIDLDHQSVRFLCRKFIRIFSSFPQCILWKEIPTYSLHLRNGELDSTSLREKNLYKLFGIPHGRFVCPIYLSIQPFISIYGNMDIYFILWVIIQ